MDYLIHLERDFHRLTEVSRDLTARVPSCPDWSAEDLLRHVAEVYLHKTQCMKLNAEPKPWPPDNTAEPALPLLHRAYAELTSQFAVRTPESPAFTWYPPDQTVGFWIRRMAQETVIHRVDAELAAGVETAPIPDDLAEDGIDEVLRLFLSFDTIEWASEFGKALSTSDGRSVAITTPNRHWLAAISPRGVTISEADASTAAGSAAMNGAATGMAAAQVSGTPEAMLRWLWRRADDESVARSGDTALVDRLRSLLAVSTQ